MARELFSERTNPHQVTASFDRFGDGWVGGSAMQVTAGRRTSKWNLHVKDVAARTGLQVRPMN
eukprot:619417-Prorocentrum_minimum.AAC.2